MPSNVRIPDEIYSALRQIRISLESKHFSAAPAMQDLVSVALKKFLEDYSDSDKKEILIEELLEHRQAARSRMGKKKNDSADET